MVECQRQQVARRVAEAILVRLEPSALAATWPKIEYAVSKAADRSHGRYTADLIRGYAQAGQWQIWIAVDDKGEICAIAGTRIAIYDTGLKAIDIKFGTGRRREIWQHFIADLLSWGKTQGCTLAEGSFRKGWRRVLPGWTHTHDSLQRDL